MIHGILDDLQFVFGGFESVVEEVDFLVVGCFVDFSCDMLYLVVCKEHLEGFYLILQFGSFHGHLGYEVLLLFLDFSDG